MKDEVIVEVAEMTLFSPNLEQKRLKAEFFAIFNEDPFATRESITPELIKEYTGSRLVKNYWQDDRFKRWFLNEKEYTQRAEYLFSRAMDELEDIIEIGNEEDDPKERAKIKRSMASTKLGAIKLMFEVTNRMPKKDQGNDQAAMQRLIGEMIGGLDNKKLKQLSKKEE